MNHYLGEDGKFVFSKVKRSEFSSELLDRLVGGNDVLKTVRRKPKGKIMITLTQEQFDSMKKIYNEKPFVHIFVNPDELIEIAKEAKQRNTSLNRGRKGKSKVGLCFSHLDNRVTFAFYDKKLPRLGKRDKKKGRKKK